MGPAADGWTVVIDPHFEFGDSDIELRQWSVGTRIARLQVIEQALFSHATVWANGGVVWDVSYEAELDERPLLDSRFPYELDALKSTVGPAEGPHTWFRVLVAAVARLTGRQPRPGQESGRPTFAELVYARSAGTAAIVARDLGADVAVDTLIGQEAE